MAYSITQYGFDAQYLCTIDEEKKSIFTTHSNLNFDFYGECGWDFTTGDSCTFVCDNHCKFKTGSMCTFDVDSESDFSTGEDCVFNIRHDCTLNVGDDCTIDMGFGCHIVGGERCVAIRRDEYEIISLSSGVSIKCLGSDKSGYLVNTREYCNKFLDNEDALIAVLKLEEYAALSELQKYKRSISYIL